MADSRNKTPWGWRPVVRGLPISELGCNVHFAPASALAPELPGTQISAQKAFCSLGFKKEAELKNFVIDIDGKSHHLVIMVNDVSELWKKMEDLLSDYDISTEH